jgi:hypothetical protein
MVWAASGIYSSIKTKNMILITNSKEESLMLKRSMLLLAAAVAVMAVTGCTRTIKDPYVRGVDLRPRSEGTQMVADLDVAPKKVLGKAEGKTMEKASLFSEAVERALNTDPSNPADVLVAPSVFYETADQDMSVTVIGYPARYKNFKIESEADKKDKTAFTLRQDGGHTVITSDKTAFSAKRVGENLILVQANDKPVSEQTQTPAAPAASVAADAPAPAETSTTTAGE